MFIPLPSQIKEIPKGGYRSDDNESEDKPTNSEAAAKVDDNESENQLEVELRIYPGNHQREGRETVTKLNNSTRI